MEIGLENGQKTEVAEKGGEVFGADTRLDMD